MMVSAVVVFGTSAFAFDFPNQFILGSLLISQMCVSSGRGCLLVASSKTKMASNRIFLASLCLLLLKFVVIAMPLTWDSTEGVAFDLTPLHLTQRNWVIQDSRNTSQNTWNYQFNIGGNCNGLLPAICRNTSGANGDWSVSKAPAFQVWLDDSRCQRLGESVDVPGSYEYALLNPANPAAGVSLTYYDGDTCLSSRGTGQYVNRAFSMKISCVNDIYDVPDVEQVDETTMCQYNVNLNNAVGCPLECPRSEGIAVCGSNGRCTVHFCTSR
jgi:hypothetical protein